MTETARTGWYHRVLREGALERGDAYRLLERPNPRLSVARVFRLRVGLEDDPALVKALAACAELSPPWREELTRAVEKYEGEGFRTARLEALLRSETPIDVASVLAEFDRDIAALRSAAAEMAQIDPQRPRHPAFSDPDRVAEAEAIVREARAAATVVDPFFLDSEKLVLDWPNLDDLLVEEFS